MSGSNRRRKRRTPQKARSTASVFCGFLSLGCLAGLWLLVQRAAQSTGGDPSRKVVAAGMLLFLISLVCLTVTGERLRQSHLALPGRLFGFLCALAAALVWGGLYIAGFFV